MPRPFDATLKQLLDEYAADWVAVLAPRLGLPVATVLEPLDVDLSSVQFSADKVFRLKPPAEGLLHIEPQASWDGELPARMMLYNALLHEKYGGPVYSVALLLRRDANASAITGTLSRRYSDDREYLRFEYSVIRVWDLPAEPLLAGPWGTIPLALLTDEAKGRLPELVSLVDERLRREHAADSTRRLLLTSCYLLLGLRYNDDEIQTAFVGATGMKESTTYQAILREGRQEGRQEGLVTARQDVLIDLLRERFGNCPPDVERKVRDAHDVNRLQAAIRQSVHIASPADLLL